MPSTVTVISPRTRLFRVSILRVRGEGLLATAQDSDFRFEGNFDHFRSFRSGVQDKLSPTTDPVWSHFHSLFTYETVMPHLLLAKLMSFTLFCRRDEGGGPKGIDHKYFFGEASCELLHLALGPPDVVLTVCRGDAVVGRLYLTCEMEEIAETKAIMRSFDVQLHDDAAVDLGAVRLVVLTKSAKKYGVYERDLGQPRAHSGHRASWVDTHTHYFGTTALELMQEAGLRFHLVKPGVVDAVVARGMALFGSYVTEQMRLEHDSIVLGRAQVEQEVVFDRVLLTNEDGSAPVGHLSGHVFLQNLPYFIQMYSGTNVDGRIYHGRRIADFCPLPPNVAPDGDDADADDGSPGADVFVDADLHG